MKTGRDYRLEMRLGDAGTGILKILRRYFPDVPLSEMRARIISRKPVYSCDGKIDGRRLLAKLLRDLEKAGAAAEIREAWTGADGAGRAAPLSKEYLCNSLRRYGEISRQVDRDMDNEADE